MLSRTMAFRGGLHHSTNTNLLLPLQRRCLSLDSPPSSSVFAWYARKLDSHPLLTKGLTSGMISGAGDAICQVLAGEERWDIARTGRFFFMGTFWVAPITHMWYGALSNRLLPGTRSVWKVAQRLMVDQFAFAPLFLPSFMGSLWLLEGRSNIVEQLKQVAPEIIVANWSLWIPAQMINLGFVPLKYQVLFGNVVALFWTVYLSYISAVTKERQVIFNGEE